MDTNKHKEIKEKVDRISYLVKHAEYNVITRKETEELKELILFFSPETKLTDDIYLLQGYGLIIIACSKIMDIIYEDN